MTRQSVPPANTDPHDEDWNSTLPSDFGELTPDDIAKLQEVIDDHNKQYPDDQLELES